MKQMSPETIRKIIDGRFQTEGSIAELTPFGNGHINDTYRVTCRLADGRIKQYILQKMNNDIFPDPDALMENIAGVTRFLKRKIQESGGNPDRETLTVIPTMEGKNYYSDQDGGNYRMYLLIEDAISLEAVEKPEDFYESAVAFGRFQRLLADYPAATLHEIIPDFHNTVSRYENLMKAAREDVCGRKREVERELQFAMDREKDCHAICDALETGAIPLRVTHNDTKLNNVMLDKRTRKGICVIDLDTVMPGSALYDYGDSIRFGANTGAEDEQDLKLVSLDLTLFEAYTKGFIEGCGGSLTRQELLFMPMSAKLMTLECGMRFLTDYLQKDVYFKIHREGHNLDRARSQFKLVADMEEKWQQMNDIVAKYL